MISAAVLDTDPKDMDLIREILVSYTIQRDIDLQIYWYTSQKSFDQLERVMRSVSIALIAVKNGDGRELGSKVYAINPDCRIIFYGPEGQQLRPLLRSRPIEYHAFSEGDIALKEKLDAILQEIADSSGVFQFKSRRRTLLLPTRNIIYFHSDLKLVQIHLESGCTETITAKLSDVEKRLPSSFIRIHQSFLVNSAHIRSLDHGERVVFISNGEVIPISDAKYESAVVKIEHISR